MIRVTVELISAATGAIRHMGTAIISNDGEGTLKHGNYEATFSKWGDPNSTWMTGKVNRFDRNRRGPWDLLYLALHSAVGKRNKAHLKAEGITVNITQRRCACGRDIQ
jgi:hypothetical protein